MQIASFRHVMPAIRRDVTLAPDTIDALDDLLKTLEVIERHKNLTRAAIVLEQKYPEIAVVMSAFAGLQISGFRYDGSDEREAAE